MSTVALPRTFRPDARALHPSQRQRSVGILSTYPPTQCGLATFAAALVGGMKQCGVTEIGVVTVGGDDGLLDAPNVVASLTPHDAVSVVRVAQTLNRFDIVIVQHEYGIYGGHDGDEVLEVMRRITRPVIATLHTVPLQPTPHQKHILESVVAEADVAVTISTTAGRRSRPRPGGWSSRTQWGRSAPTTSPRCCWTSTTRPASSTLSTGRSSPPSAVTATATSRTSCTRAGAWSAGTPC